MIRARAMLLALLVAGCSCGETAAPATTVVPPPTSAPPAPVASTTPTPPASSARTAPTPPTAEALRTMRTELREGRRLAHAGNPAGAIAHYQAALAAVPSGRTRCEAGYVAHQAGQAELASTLVTQALGELPDAAHATAEMRVPLAQCLYNAGLVLETSGDMARARDAFQRSLALRPNATVQTALARVGGPREGTRSPARGSIDERLEAQRAAWCTDVSEECPSRCPESRSRPDTSESATACRTMRLGAGAIPGTPGFEAVLFEGDDFWSGVLSLVLGEGDAGTSVVLAQSTRPGAEMGNSDAYELGAMSWQDVIPGGPTELVIEVSSSGSSHQGYEDEENEGEDEGDEREGASPWCDDNDSTEWATTYVCASTDAGVRCVALTRSMHASTQHACYDETSGHDLPGSTDVSTTWALDLSFDHGQAVLAEATPFSSSAENAAEERAAYQARLGRHDLAAMLRDQPCEDLCGP